MINSHEFQQQYHNIVLVNDFLFIYFSHLLIYFHTDIPDHMSDDLNQISNPSGMSIITPPFSHLSHSHPHQHPININKKDDDHLFLHPSCMGDNHRRMQDTYLMPSNNSNNIHQHTPSVCIIYN